MWVIVNEFVRIFYESAPYLLLGFALAGVLHVLFSRSDRFSRMLSRRGSRSVVLAALFGVPLPLCSCSVLPAALALRKSGATKGATASFLISVPETDVVSIIMTYGLLGPLMAVARPVAALFTAIFTGLAMNLADRWAEPDDDQTDGNAGDEDCVCDAPNERGPVAKALHYGFVEFMDDIAGSLLVGLLLGGVITAVLPAIGLGEFVGGSFWTMLAMLAIGMPMYVCATASTPIAAGLIAGGLSPGAALVFLLAGPATNMASVVVLAKHLGKTALGIYLASIAVVSVAMGLALDALLAGATAPILTVAPPEAGSAITLLEVGSSILLAVVMYMSLRRGRAFERSVQAVGRVVGAEFSPRGVKTAGVVVAVIAYIGSGLFVVGPGERGVVTRFGRITASNLRPGLHYSWPYPIGDRDLEQVTEIKRIELGFRRGSDRTVSAWMDESWMLTGNEDIIDITWVVQYRVRDSEAALLEYLYGIGDPEGLVRDAAESAIRAVVGGRNIDTLLTVDRRAVELAVKDEFLQPWLDRCNSGVEVVAVKLQDVHAPPDVHSAFRDVASAAENKETSINAAYEYEERVVREAAGQAAQRVLTAEANAIDNVENATGEASAFLDQLSAYRASRAVTRTRLYFEMIDDVYARVAKYVNLIDGLDGGLDLWMVPRRQAVPLPPASPVNRGRPF